MRSDPSAEDPAASARVAGLAARDRRRSEQQQRNRRWFRVCVVRSGPRPDPADLVGRLVKISRSLSLSLSLSLFVSLCLKVILIGCNFTVCFFYIADVKATWIAEVLSIRLTVDVPVEG